MTLYTGDDDAAAANVDCVVHSLQSTARYQNESSAAAVVADRG